MNNIIIGMLLKKIREYKHLSIEEAARFLSLEIKTLEAIEKGTHDISDLEFNLIKKLYDLDELKDYNIHSSISNIKGIILAGGTGSRLFPITNGTSKQLVPVYDKPMIYYPLSVLMQAGIKDILIISTKEDQPNFKRLLDDGSQYGIKITYTIQPSPDGLAQAFILGEDFIENNPCAMILGDNIFHGDGLDNELKKASRNAINGYATIFGYKVKDPQRFGIMEIDKYHNVLSVEEKPEKPKSDYAITGLYFYPTGVSSFAKTIKPSKRNELEITSLNDIYLKKNLLKARILGDGYTWFDTGTFDSLLEASEMVRSIERNKDAVICCPEAIALKHGWLNRDKLFEKASKINNSYWKYLARISETK